MKLVHMASGLAVAIALAACADSGYSDASTGCKYVYFSNTTTCYPATECLRYRLDPSESRTAA